MVRLIGSISVLVVAITVGVVANVHLNSGPKAVSRSATILSVPPQSDRGGKIVSDRANSIPISAPRRTQPRLTQKAQGSLPARRTTPEQPKRPTLQPHEQRSATAAHELNRPGSTPHADQRNGTLTP